MISLLSGSVVHQDDRTMTLLAGGVGYEVFPTDGARALVDQSQEVRLVIHTHVREDQITLFAFASHVERQVFRLLISVSGIGPKSALDILRSPAHMVVQALLDEDVSFLVACPGVGKKTAERLIIDLKEKVRALAPGLPSEGLSLPQVGHGRILEENYADVVEALVRLGYDKRLVLPVISRCVEEYGAAIPSEEDIIRFALAHL